MAGHLNIHPFKYIKRYLPKKLFGRTLAIMLTPVIIIMFVIAYVFFDRLWTNTTRRFAEDIAADVAAIVYMLEDKPFAEIQTFAKRHFDMHLTISNQLLIANPSSVFLREIGADYLANSLKRQGLLMPLTLKVDSTHIYLSLKQPDYVLDFAINRKRLLSRTITVFLLWLFGAPLLLLLIAVMFLRNQIRPILRLAKAVDNFGKGKDVSNFHPEGAYEVRKAAIAFNQMRERINRQISQRTEMLAGVSHDLRTPLTRMKLQATMIKDKETKAGLLKDIDDMGCMVEAFLEFAKNNELEKPQYIRVRQILQEIVDTYDIKAEMDLPKDLKMPLRRQHFKRAITNLLDNAQKYAKHTVLTATIGSENLKIYIDDDGPGIEEEKRQEVFQPFYRQDKSRNLDVHGLGLGLSIAQDSIYQHGGTIKLHDSKLGGLRVAISIPL
jgi:two-component system osmolarity sensor histidine kinase EnvZ